MVVWLFDHGGPSHESKESRVYSSASQGGPNSAWGGTGSVRLIVDSSMESEAIASSKGGEAISYAREVLRGLGVAAGSPTLLTTDNLANQKVGSGLGCPTRSRHFLRRYWALKQRIAAGEVTLRYVPDAHMPADFLTKWIPKSKLDQSIAFVTNSRASSADACRVGDPCGSGGVSAVGHRPAPREKRIERSVPF